MKIVSSLLFLVACLSAHAQTATNEYIKGPLLFEDSFREDGGHWRAELESGGKVNFQNGQLEIDVPGGATLWLRQILAGPLVIEYDATVIVAGAKNDRLSDLNCFWMARDSRSPDDLFATARSGKFADYNFLKTYYVGQGGNNNSTTRFRRYIGDETLRPLLPEHDLKAPEHLLTANRSQKIEITAAGSQIQYRRDGVLVFDFQDPEPYRSGHFAFRTVNSHLSIRNFRIHRLLPSNPSR